MTTIYVIYHLDYENTNIFTTDKTKIKEIIADQMKKYTDTKGEWRYRIIQENTEFDMDGSFHDAELFGIFKDVLGVLGDN